MSNTSGTTYKTKILEQLTVKEIENNSSANTNQSALAARIEKSSGQLLLYIKKATLVRGFRKSYPPSLEDFEDAYQRISSVATRFNLSMRSQSGLYNGVNLSSRVLDVHSIDPIWHRSMVLAFRDPNFKSKLKRKMETNIHLFWSQNLFGRTAFHMTLRHNLRFLEPIEILSLPDAEQHILSRVDIWGMGIVMAILYYRRGSLPPLPTPTLLHGCFVRKTQPKGRDFRNLVNFPVEFHHWAYLEPIQLVAINGDTDQFKDLHDMGVLLPWLERTIYTEGGYRVYMPGIDPHPVVLASFLDHEKLAQEIVSRYSILEGFKIPSLCSSGGLPIDYHQGQQPPPKPDMERLVLEDGEGSKCSFILKKQGGEFSSETAWTGS
ncbi:hypothetical protein ABW19_dt0208836 [Dactylella cylindrospora]|nr:hypothetical protein ABW19_dt0208836 [Dactylella cylindrospora]